MLLSLKEKKYIFHFDKPSKSICFYDDFEFERNDLEIIDPLLKKKDLDLFLKENGFTRQVQDCYLKELPGDNLKVNFLKLSRTRMQLLSSIKDLFETDSYYVVSPSEQASLILQSQTSDYEERLLSLSSKLPFNLHKFNHEKKIFKA